MRVGSIVKYMALLSLAIVIVFAAMSVIDATPALAHCDGLDGPVVGAARIAHSKVRVFDWDPIRE